MASTNTLNVTIDLMAQETLDATAFPGSSQTQDRTLRGGANVSAELNATSTPSVDAQMVQQDITIGAGTTTIDLTAAPIGISRTTTLLGMRLIAWAVVCSASNTGGVTIAAGASNGYAIWGAADGKYVFQPGETAGSVVSGAAAARAAVGLAAKNIAVSGTLDDTCEIRLWFGT